MTDASGHSLAEEGTKVLSRIEMLKRRAAMRQRIRVVVAQRRLQPAPVETPAEPEPRD
ncbi:MAG: hypothetical protein HOU81_11815 [Hamadaea sp.]|uniref:hypothetical protein n=1 Tax=Hamadaea sp. TaxID=2024425 RepID=UPI0017D48F35|nr:hypothetical protein [Hamadaea sp.]NUR71499.1 hypothetical protein [Hamadaea sp.]NUT22146.1 hypothetical protein [Hamadaea sp.]